MWYSQAKCIIYWVSHLKFTISSVKHTEFFIWLRNLWKADLWFLALGGHSNGKRGIRLVHAHTKSTLITYFSGMKIDPKYAFLHAFFCHVLSKICLYDQKTHLFFPILHVFAPLNDVRAYSAWSWKTTLITWIFGRAWYPPWHSNGPPWGFWWTINKEIQKELNNVKVLFKAVTNTAFTPSKSRHRVHFVILMMTKD